MDGWFQRLEEEYEASKSYKPNKADWLEMLDRFQGGAAMTRVAAHRRFEELFREVGRLLCVSGGFNVNRKIVRQLENRRRMIETEEGIDWSTAEALAFGRSRWRLSHSHVGQDSLRGTFSASCRPDRSKTESYKPLEHIRPINQGRDRR